MQQQQEKGNGKQDVTPWDYFAVPIEDRRDLMQLWYELYLKNPVVLTRGMQQVMYTPEELGLRYKELQGADASKAALWFLVADFIGMKYARYHPKFRMKDMPVEVLMYLRPPYRDMKNLAYDEQKRFKATLPKELQELIYLDE